MHHNINMKHLFGIRRENKSKWERRTPLIPEDIEELRDQYSIQCMVQPSPIRIYTDTEYKEAGVDVQEDISECKIIFAVKEIDIDFFKQGRTYIFFSHTIKGQSFNMPMLKKILDLGCTLIDYEKIIDNKGRRIIFFGRYAGLAGMIDTLWAIGKRLQWERIDSPFTQIRQAYHYQNLAQAKEAVRLTGDFIKKNGLPNLLIPFICGFAGYGNVSKGAQEIYDELPVEEIGPAELSNVTQSNMISRQKVYKVIFKEKDIVCHSDSNIEFDLNDYYNHPEKYQSQFERYLPHLTLLVNAIYWDDRYPRLVTKKNLKNLFKETTFPRLRVIGDISCDVEGAIECTLHCNEPDSPVFIYDPIKDVPVDGFEENGIVVLAVDNLPCELPYESSADFSTNLKKFVPAIVKADYSVDFEKCNLPDPIRKAVIAYRGKLTQDFEYIKEYF